MPEEPVKEGVVYTRIKGNITCSYCGDYTEPSWNNSAMCVNCKKKKDAGDML